MIFSLAKKRLLIVLLCYQFSIVIRNLTMWMYRLRVIGRVGSVSESIIGQSISRAIKCARRSIKCAALAPGASGILLKSIQCFITLHRHPAGGCQHSTNVSCHNCWTFVWWIENQNENFCFWILKNYVFTNYDNNFMCLYYCIPFNYS